jgi:Cro/C1-type HTH DNA-binding domain
VTKTALAAFCRTLVADVFQVESMPDRATGAILRNIFPARPGQTAGSGRRAGIFASFAGLLAFGYSICNNPGMAITFSDQLRRAIKQSDYTCYRIAKTTGINESQLSRFMRGKAGLSPESIDQICKLIGAKLTVKQTAKK